jgi:hypothetical protein
MFSTHPEALDELLDRVASRVKPRLLVIDQVRALRSWRTRPFPGSSCSQMSGTAMTIR